MAARKRWEDGCSDGRGGTTDALTARRDTSDALNAQTHRMRLQRLILDMWFVAEPFSQNKKKAARRDLRAARG